ncbi:thioredoxin-dependent thiol peroxidase [Crocinitomicaceae bacterium CZZ-1]|uniref:thioredoxin-dependent peroxiredoxin n=1 Tax=Taishania pollutisoli TaxID=2766479 RepID=A0A8J6PCZ1_9FLAO|nr:thioredoxin-dependent thiol peroxidase [Taishania pollutisoli]MBC9812838.1 thioredoxin-dependent thiol peroxidase [Taishania pollutisoli]MBX2949711.1 thioredoxin-dependent thiol peroxidase [Crocinitomicaceae bacterium]NGF76131.1 thioredoxin-dependent thiol peroxidase [Fluviicola sp. SGL-29]
MKTLKIGERAPEFTGLDQNGKKVSLADYKGKKLVLYFYPKDNTPGCTAQACNLRDNEELLASKGIAVVGVSADSVNSHGKFSNKYTLNFPLLADTDKIILNQYGVWGEKKFMGRTFDGIHRTTFIIDEQQNIMAIINKPDTKNHAEEILKILEENQTT